MGSDAPCSHLPRPPPQLIRGNPQARPSHLSSDRRPLSRHPRRHMCLQKLPRLADGQGLQPRLFLPGPDSYLRLGSHLHHVHGGFQQVRRRVVGHHSSCRLARPCEESRETEYIASGYARGDIFLALTGDKAVAKYARSYPALRTHQPVRSRCLHQNYQAACNPDKLQTR